MTAPGRQQPAKLDRRGSPTRGDIACDVALYAPLALVSPFTVLQVALVLSLVVAGELAGVCSDWLGAGRRCEGPLGKVDRAIVFATLNIWLGS